MGGGWGKPNSSAKGPSSERNVTSLPLQAMHEDKLADLPTDSLDGFFGHTFPVVKESDVRSEFLVVLHSAFYEFLAQASMGLPQGGAVAAVTEDTGPATWLARETSRPVKFDLEWLHGGGHCCAGKIDRLDDIIWHPAVAAKKMQHDMEALCGQQLSTQTVFDVKLLCE